MRDIRGKRALVTGAASGIGRALALRLAREGVHLFLLDVDEAGLEETAAAARKLGVEVIARRCDLRLPADVTLSTRHLLAAWGGLDILVNNAGVAYYGPAAKMAAAGRRTANDRACDPPAGTDRTGMAAVGRRCRCPGPARG